MPSLVVPRLFKGTITAWKGLISNIPSGWAICDGTNGTPDLRAKFVAGAASGQDAGATGGSDTHILTEAELAVHSHGISESTHAHASNLERGVSGSGAGSIDDEVAGDAFAAPPNTSADGTGATLASVGSGTSHENMPAFYETIYIMKIAF